MRRRTKWFVVLAMVLALPLAEVACRAMRPSPPPPPPPPVAPPAVGLDAMTFPQWVAALRTDAESGKDADLAAHADLLAAIATHALEATADVRVERSQDIEPPLSTKWNGNRAWATIATYLEAGADSERMARVYRTYERYAEWTGKQDGRLVSRTGDVAEVAVDGKFRILAFEFGPKWHFRARPIERGRGRHINVCWMVPAPDSEHVLESRGLLVAFPERDGTRVVESNVTVVDIGIPALFEGAVQKASMKDLRERMEGLRHRWRELPTK